MHDPTDRRTWSAVDDYLEERLRVGDDLLQQVINNCRDHDLPPYEVSPLLAETLAILVGATSSRRVLEVGTLGGFSAICMARVLPTDGELITLEIDERHASVAADNFQRASLTDRIDLRLGDASRTLEGMIEDETEPFDFVFVDADKERNATYFELVLKLSRPGTLIIVDNVVREGGILDQETKDAKIRGVQSLLNTVHSNARVHASALQTVGKKTYDGLLLLRVKD